MSCSSLGVCALRRVSLCLARGDTPKGMNLNNEHDPSCVVGMSMCVNRNYDTNDTWMIDERTRPAKALALGYPTVPPALHRSQLLPRFRCPERRSSAFHDCPHCSRIRKRGITEMLTIFLDWLSIKHLSFHSQVREKRLRARVSGAGRNSAVAP